MKMNPTDHPVGSRFLCQLSSTPTLAEILEWSPSGKYVSVELTTSVGGCNRLWTLPQNLPIIEQLNSYFDEDKEYLRAFNQIRAACAARGLELDFNHDLEQILDFIRTLGTKDA